MSIIKFSNGKALDLSRPHIMGILNVTPDSFSDGGQNNQLDSAVKAALEMLKQGATIIDIGGESTRPGAPDVALAEELARVIPVIRAIRAVSDCVVSIDTSKAEVMRQAIAAGANIINDVRALQEPGALEVAAQLNVPVCLMHMQGQPRTMQHAPHYDDMLSEIKQFFISRIEDCTNAGIAQENIILDPGFGFGKTLDHNYQLLKHMDAFSELGCPILAGLSRKSMFGNLLNRQTDERLAASLAGALIAVQKGATIIRVHDVTETNDVIKVWLACEQGIINE